MKTCVLAILTCLTVTTTALAIPPPDPQAPFIIQEDGSSETAITDDYEILPPKAPVATSRPSSAPLPMLFIDGPTTGEDDNGGDNVPSAIVVVPEEDIEEASASCFCAGGAICCRSRGETDCSFGVCGI